jgi:hypothetical protein
MRGVEHLDKSGPIAIVNEYSEYPYAHFTVPVCGLPMSKVDVRGGSKRRAQSRKVAKTSVFADPKHDASLKTDSIDSTEPPPRTQQSSGTVVSLPPLKSASDTTAENGSGPIDSSFAEFHSSHNASYAAQASDSGKNGGKGTLSSSAKQFLQQIPDLSFMLKPTLSLPKKS